MGRKQKERQKKKNEQKLLALATGTATEKAAAAAVSSSGKAVGGGNNSATAGRSSSVIDGEGDADAAKKEATTETTTIATSCYHGSTADNFVEGSKYRMVINEWLSIFILMILADTNEAEFRIVISNFHVKHKKLMNNPEFNQCVFAVATDIFLNSSGSEEYSSSKPKLLNVLRFGIRSKYYGDRDKYNKYLRDIETNRGIINVLYRETNTFCKCMTPYKEETKTMEKVGHCYECCQEFPKKLLRRCSRCLVTQYCSNTCMKKSWPTHKQFCRPHNKSEER